MNINITATSRRYSAIEAFQRLNLRARMSHILRSAFSRNGTLVDFNERAPLLNPTRKLRGIQDIPVSQIIGSLGRVKDFDRDFRPLKKHLRDRWVRNLLLLETDSWEPIRVHKIGRDYFVEDGHHRVSVARYTGMAFIHAEVWEHTLKTGADAGAMSLESKERKATRVIPAACTCEARPAG